MRIASLALVASLAACTHAPGPKGVENRAEPPQAELMAKDPLAFLPRDSELVIDVDLARMKASPLWESQLAPQARRIEVALPLAQAREKCGIDFLAATTRFSTGMKKVGDHFSGVMVLRGPDAAATMACIEKTATSGKAARDGNTLLVRSSGSMTMAIAAVGQSTLVVLTDAAASRAMLAEAIASGTPLRSSPAFIELHDALAPDASLSMIANGASSMFEPMRSFGISPRWVVMTATVGTSYAVDGRITMQTADDAQRVAGMMLGNLGSLKPMVERLDIRPEGEVVRVDVAVTKDQADKILGMLGGVFTP